MPTASRKDTGEEWPRCPQMGRAQLPSTEEVQWVTGSADGLWIKSKSGVKPLATLEIGRVGEIEDGHWSHKMSC